MGHPGLEPRTSSLKELCGANWLTPAKNKGYEFCLILKLYFRLSLFRKKSIFQCSFLFPKTKLMKIHCELLEEVNLLFEMIKTMLITGLSQTKINQLLKKYTHYEIRNGKFVK